MTCLHACILSCLGNSWACGDDGKCCVGCGNQEEFYACADVTILPGTGRPAPTTKPTTTVPTTADAGTNPAVGPVTRQPGVPGGSDPSTLLRYYMCPLQLLNTPFLYWLRSGFLRIDFISNEAKFLKNYQH